MEKIKRERRAELDLLLGFANTDLTKEEHRRPYSTLMDRLLQHPALHEDNRRRDTSDDFVHIMDALQRHLRNRFRKVVKNNKMLGSMPMWRVSGSACLELDPIGSRFQEQFQLRKVKPGNEVKALKKIIDLWLMEIIRELDFNPRQIGRCLLCGGFFFRPTIKEKRYCSERCINTARQQKYRAGRRKIAQ